MTEFEDFKPFFEAMIAEMQRHDPEKGDSWKGEWKSLDGEDMINYELNQKLGRCFLKYWRRPEENLDELIDIANLCGMRWLRGSTRSKTQ